jgi:hypothetical protein
MGSSGGGSSGAVTHSAYLEAAHHEWMNQGGADVIESSITDCMNAAIGNSPWVALNAYDPANDIALYEAEFAAYKILLLGLDEGVIFDTIYTSIGTTLDTSIPASVSAYSDILDDEINTKVLPRFRRGMQDINAVQASSYVIGAAVIESFKTRDVAKFTTELTLKLNEQKNQSTIVMTQFMSQRISWNAEFVRSFTDAMRIKIIAHKEQIDQDMTIDEKDALWDLEVFQYGANLMAAIAGGTTMNKAKTPSAAQSALGGAMSGASAGSAFGPWGAVIGAVVGAAAGYASST